MYSERMANQLIWSRTINTSGKQGRNIPMDLHMEHLNKNFKGAISHLGPNNLGPSLQRTGKALKVLMDMQSHYDEETAVPKESWFH